MPGAQTTVTSSPGDLPEPGHSPHDQVVAGQRAGFVETAHLDLAGKGDAEGLGAVHVWERRRTSGQPG